MQSRSVRLGQIMGYGVLSGIAAGGVATGVGAALAHRLTVGTVATALGWGAVTLLVYAGSIVYSQNALGAGEAALRARLGEGYRRPPLPLAQIVIPAIGAVLLLLVQYVIWPC